MMVNEKSDNSTSVSQVSENTECEAQDNDDNDYTDDSYPYVIRGLLWALLFATIFWVIFIGGILLIVF